MLDDLTTEALDKTVHSVAHGVIRLEELAPDYGAERRRLRVVKYRGQRFRGGYHDFAIETGGVQVFPAPGRRRAPRRVRARAHQQRHCRSWMRCSAAASSAARAR